MFISSGILEYSQNPYKLILSVDNDLGRLTRALLPKYLNVKPPMWSSHISVVRKWTPPNMEFWNKYQGKEVSFEYESYVYNDELYYWLNCFSKELEDIRTELGMKLYSDITLSSYWQHTFHCTVGNLKK